MQNYFSRQLDVSIGDEKRTIKESDLFACPGPWIVLGEPGMGKTAFVRNLALTLGISVVSAARFSVTVTPSRLVIPGKPLLIDGLDEAMTRDEGDAVTRILAKLEEAGSPPFVLCCRSREWQLRAARGISEIYGHEPSIATLRPFSHQEAREFLRQHCGLNDPDAVIREVDERDLIELTGIPLMLNLIGKVATKGGGLPTTRSGLIEQACRMLCSEHNPERQDIGLGTLSVEAALDSAGAICAALILGGAQAVADTSPHDLQAGEIRLADITCLPSAEAFRTVLSSNLFFSIDIARTAPLHRLIAEYLGARWLVRQAKSLRAQRRLLLHFHSRGRVAASLRGVHAWLAYHSPSMCRDVIRADPFGVLRQGEVATIGDEQAGLLLEALEALATDDPYFRSRDFRAQSAKGLMVPALAGRIKNIISSPDSNEHLRSLLIEGMEGTPLSSDLSAELEAILLDRDRFYRERDAAAQALWTLHDGNWRIAVIEELRCQGTEDSTRLASELVEINILTVSDEMLVSTLFAELGFTIMPWPKRNERFVTTIRIHDHIAQNLPAGRMPPVLDRMTQYAQLLEDGRWSERRDIERIASQLILRLIEGNHVGPKDASRLWSWLGIFYRYDGRGTEDAKKLAECLERASELRRAVQHHVAWQARTEKSLWATLYWMQRRFVGIVDHEADIAALLNHLAGADNTDEQAREDWGDLMRLSMRNWKIEPALREIGRRFQQGDEELEAYLLNLENPKKDETFLEFEAQEIAHKEAREARFTKDRQYVLNHLEKLRDGELELIVRPAQAYLGILGEFGGHKVSREPLDIWLGDELTDVSFQGFEAVLHRADLPSPLQMSESYAWDKEWNMSYAIMAGLFLRQQCGQGLVDLPMHILQAGLLLCIMRSGHTSDQEARGALEAALQPLVLTDEHTRESFARLIIEPSLAARKSHVSGLHQLAHEPEWRSTGAKLLAEWLQRFPDVPENVELELIDSLIATGNLKALCEIAGARAGVAFRDLNQLKLWLSVDALVRFDAIAELAPAIGEEMPDLLWLLRDRFKPDRHERLLPVTVEQAGWVVSSFRCSWPNRSYGDGRSGDANPADAADFLRAMISLVAEKTDEKAISVMSALRGAPEDTYSRFLRHMAAEQMQKRAEMNLTPLAPVEIASLLEDGLPTSLDDLKAIVLEELGIAQAKLRGDDIDTMSVFWTDDGAPRDENWCRDRLASLIGPELMRYDVCRITEADMPLSKRADLAFAYGEMQLPMEVKGQWHPDVWDAAMNQLDARYLIDWRSEGRGIYCVLWFGDLPAKTGRRLTRPPEGTSPPKDAIEMQRMLVERIPITNRNFLDVFVVDFSKRTTKYSTDKF